MKTFNPIIAFALAVMISFLTTQSSAVGQDDPQENQNQANQDQAALFSRPMIDLGCVVSDVDAAVKFYTTAIGFKEVKGFSVDAEFASAVGLTDQKKLDVRVLKLGDGDGATALKLLQIAGDSQKPKNDFIHSSLGLSYLSIYVKDMDAAIERLESAGSQPLAQPQTIPGTPVALVLVRDPDGNLIELIGPMADNGVEN